MAKKPDKNYYDRKEPTVMSHQLYIFADAYFYATGRERTFKHAALKAGVSEGSAAAQGHYFSKFKVVQEYWKALQDSLSEAKQRINEAAYRELQHYAFHDPQLKYQERISLLLKLAEMTDKSFDPPPILISPDGKDSKKEEPIPEDDPNTKATMDQLLYSVELLVAKKSGGGEDA